MGGKTAVLRPPCHPPSPPPTTPDSPDQEPCTAGRMQTSWGVAPPSKLFLGRQALVDKFIPRPVPVGGQERTDTWSLGGAQPEGSKPHKCQ